MQLFLRDLQGHSSALSVHCCDTVAQLKAAVEVNHGIPANEQLLTANGRVLLDAHTLACAGLQQGSTVQLLLRLCGGKGGFGALLRGQGRDGKITDNFDACRDLSGRRIRHVEAERKLQDWKKDAKERELEQVAMKHMKEMAQQAKRDKEYKINVEEVKQQHKQAADAVVEAVHTALAEGLQQQRKNGGGGTSKAGNGAAAAAAATAGPSKAADQAAAGAAEAVSPGSKRKASDAAAAAAGVAEANGSSPAKKRKVTMLNMLDGADSDADSSSESDGDE